MYAKPSSYEIEFYSGGHWWNIRVVPDGTRWRATIKGANFDDFRDLSKEERKKLFDVTSFDLFPWLSGTMKKFFGETPEAAERALITAMKEVVEGKYKKTSSFEYQPPNRTWCKQILRTLGE